MARRTIIITRPPLPAAAASRKGEVKNPKKPKRDLNNLGVRPRKMEAHGRFQLWAVGILYWLAIVLQCCALWSEDWIEERDSLLGRQGKDLEQWFLLGGGYFSWIIRIHFFYLEDSMAKNGRQME